MVYRLNIHQGRNWGEGGTIIGVPGEGGNIIFMLYKGESRLVIDMVKVLNFSFRPVLTASGYILY